MTSLKFAPMLAVWLAQAAFAQPGPEHVRRFGWQEAALEVTVRGTTDLDLFAGVLEAFVADSPDIAVVYEQWGSNDLDALTRQDCRKRISSADLVISSAVDLQVKLVNDGCARAHVSGLTASLPDNLNWRNEVFGITREPAVIVYNRDLVPASEAPRTRFDLIDLLRSPESRFAGKVATYDIEASGLGYLFAFLDAQQATTFGSLIEAFARSGAVSTCCSAEIIDGVASGEYLLAYNVLGSYALARAREADNLIVVAPQDYTLVLARGALIPKYSRDPVSAGLLLDFLLSDTGQRVLAADELFVDVTTSDGSWLDPAAESEAVLRPVALSPVLLVGLDRQKREGFLALWRDTFAQSRRAGPFREP
ncbi:ABC transporter substrate-binding protein [Amaricoccus macauensis]|uniref:ABC transporter substrate-binding protein n=1 Tax=Amaricoccus macauensis TaxID=57001 RepID=UPI003C79EEAB